MATIVSSQYVNGILYYTIQVVTQNSTGQNATSTISGLTASDLYSQYGIIAPGFTPPGAAPSLVSVTSLTAVFTSPNLVVNYTIDTPGIAIVIRINGASYQQDFDLTTNPQTFTFTSVVPTTVRIYRKDTGAWISNITSVTSGSSTPPSPPSISTQTIDATSGSYSVSAITSAGTSTIQLNVKGPNDSAFSVLLPAQPLGPNGLIGFTLPLSRASAGTYGTWSFQAQAFNSLGQGSALSNIATIVLNAPTPTILSNIVVVKAVDGTQATFSLSPSDAGAIQSSQVLSSTPSINPPTNTITDLQNFFQAHNQSSTPPPVVTPAPTGLIATVNNGDVALTWTSQYPITLTMNGTIVVNNYAANAYTRFGLPNGTYTFTMFATNPTNSVNSSVIQVVANVNYTAPTQANNYAYNIQIPNVNNALQLITSTNYGTSSQISFPAKAFVQNILNQNVSTIPNTLNALFISQVSTTPNEVTVANALIGYFPATPPQTGPKRSVIEIAGGIFAGLITLSLFTSGNNSKVKRKHA